MERRETKRDKGERDKAQIAKSIKEIMLSPDCVTAMHYRVRDMQYYAANLDNLSN